MLARYKRFLILASVVVLLLVAYTVAGFWGVPHFLRSGLTDFVSTHYKRKLALGEIRFNPYLFTLDVNELSLPDTDGQPMLSFGHLHVDMQMMSLLKLGPYFREILLERPQVRTVIRPDGSLNLADLGKGFEESSKPPAKASEPMRLFVDRFAVVAGETSFEDRSHSTPFRADFKPIAFELKNFSTRAKKGANDENEYSLTAASPQGERLTWNGSFLLSPLSAHGTFEVADVQANTLWSYIQQPLPLEIGSGVIGVKGEYSFDAAGQAPVIKVNVHDTLVSNLRLRPRGGSMDYVVLGKLDVRETQVDVGQRSVEVGKVSLSGGEVNAWLSERGQLNLLELTTPSNAGASGRADVSAAGADGSSAAGAPPAANPQPAATEAGAPVAGASGRADVSAAGADGSSAAGAPPAANPQPAATEAGAPVAGSAAKTQTQTPTPTITPTQPAASAPWTVSVPDINVENFKIAAEDRQVSPALVLHLDPLDIHVAGYNTKPDAKLDVTAKTTINGSSTLNATAQVANGGTGDIAAHVDVAKLDLALFQPFIAQRTAMTLQAGLLDSQLDIKKGTDGSLSVNGDVGVSNLRSVDELQQSFIKWKEVRIAGLQYNLQPASLHIDSITARQPYARVIIAPDRTVNVEEVLAGPKKGRASLATQLGAANAAGGTSAVASTIAANANADNAAANANSANDTADAVAAGAKATVANAAAVASSAKAAASDAKAAAANANASVADATAKLADATDQNAQKGKKKKFRPTGKETAPAPSPSEPLMPISIGTVRIIDGSANYADFWIQPNFAVGIQTLNGSIDGLSSNPKSRAKVMLDGKVDRYAPVNIDGEMNLLAASVYSDIKMSFKGLELTTMTPYSGRFAGYKIDKGKLSVDLSYKVDQRKLTAEQRFVIDQLQLGDPVESPDAVHLPLKIAVALLKDRNGVIDVPLPISGSLDDPQFKVGPIIWHAVVNLLEKVAIAPFAAIGRLFGGGKHGEDMKFIDFAAGSAELDDESKEKLDTLTQALKEHNQLQLDVPIVFSPELDKPELAKRRLNQRLAARAQSEGGRGKKSATPVAAGPEGLLADPLQHYKLLLAEYQASVGKDAELPPTAKAIQEAKNKKDAPPVESAIPELEDAIAPHIDVPDLQLQELGKRRTRAIQNVLLADGGIDASRVFIINGNFKPDDSGKVRVEMALK